MTPLPSELEAWKFVVVVVVLVHPPIGTRKMMMMMMLLDPQDYAKALSHQVGLT